MNDLQTATELRATAAYLRKHGWLQRAFGEDGGSRCLAGAYASACGVDANELASAGGFRPLAKTLDLMGMDGHARIAQWNDAQASVEPVLDRLESTALGLEVRALAAKEVGAGSICSEMVQSPLPEPVGV